ncbi:AbrB/MazE/SpoVT family DNA-binding domain-containing protein [Candidatus Woesearchaeota archaeon]|nr:AbrB/MazE/SpoVT family DNA-binding domain-containing protein [Candidatus Woesearchaeota archaeon]
MQIRKLVKSGTASHTISLPKDWIQKNKLKKGDLLYIKEENNNIIISPEQKEQPVKHKEITITIDNKDIGTIRRETISSYINNYHIFTFIGNINKNIEELRKILDNFLALEIIEQTDKKLVAKDFLNLQEFSLNNTIRRMDMLTRSMLTDTKGKSQSKALELMDFEVDKLFFLISRLIRANLTNETSKINNVEALSIWWLAKNIESIADSAKYLILSKQEIKLFEEAENYYKESIKSYFKKDKQLADKLIAQRKSLLEKAEKLKNKELLKKIVNNSRNIAKIVLDS